MQSSRCRNIHYHLQVIFACLGTVVVQSYVGPLSDKVRMLDDDIL